MKVEACVLAWPCDRCGASQAKVSIVPSRGSVVSRANFCADCARAAALDMIALVLPAWGRFGEGAALAPAERPRLGRQLDRVIALMVDGQWRGLDQIAAACGATEAAASARLRDMRKLGFVVERERRFALRGPAGRGPWMYRAARAEGGGDGA